MPLKVRTRTSVRARRRMHAIPRSSLALALLLALPAMAQEAPAEQDEATTLDTVTVTGSRVQGRTAEQTAAPVDIIGQEELANTGAMEVGQALQLLEPSFNFSRTTVSDGRVRISLTSAMLLTKYRSPMRKPMPRQSPGASICSAAPATCARLRCS